MEAAYARNNCTFGGVSNYFPCLSCLSYFWVSGFASASTVYVTVNGIPLVLWKTKAEPANASEPVLIGVLVTVTGVLEKVVMVESAICVVLSIHLAL
jgi:hypothetical protein